MMPILTPPADDSSWRFAGPPRQDVRAAGDTGQHAPTAPSGGAVNAYRLITRRRPTQRESVIGSSFLATTAVAALGAAALGFTLRRRQKQNA